MADERFHHHIEYGRGHQVAPRDPPGALEWDAIVVPFPGYHREYLPISAEEAFSLWPDSVG